MDFDINRYLQEKTNQLNTIGESNKYGSGPWNVYQTAAAIKNAGMTPEEHYKQYGMKEGINMSAPTAQFNAPGGLMSNNYMPYSDFSKSIEGMFGGLTNIFDKFLKQQQPVYQNSQSTPLSGGTTSNASGQWGSGDTWKTGLLSTLANKRTGWGW